MKVTNVFFIKKEESKIKAIVSFEFHGLVVDDFKIIQGSDGLFVGWPSREFMDKETNEKKYKRTLSTEDQELFKEINTAILNGYYDEANSQGIITNRPVNSENNVKEWKKQGEEVTKAYKKGYKRKETNTKEDGDWNNW